MLTSARRVSATSAQRLAAAISEEGVSLFLTTGKIGGASNAQVGKAEAAAGAAGTKSGGSEDKRGDLVMRGDEL